MTERCFCEQTDSVRFWRILLHSQIPSQPCSLSALHKPSTGNGAGRMELIKIRRTAHSLSQVAAWLMKSQKSAHIIWEINERKEKEKKKKTAKQPEMSSFSGGGEGGCPLCFFGPLTWRCHRPSQAISVPPVPAVGKSIEVLKDASLRG